VLDPNHALFHPRYSRSNAYDPEWVFENQMPNVWLLESLTEVLAIEPACVLDLGAAAMTSVFLAREFGAEVWATTSGSQPRTTRRASAAGVDDLVHAVYAKAHQLRSRPSTSASGQHRRTSTSGPPTSLATSSASSAAADASAS
jgi:hypothetical protein